MLFLKYLLCTIGTGLLLAGAGILIYDLYLTFRTPTPRKLRSGISLRLEAIGIIPLLLGMSLSVVPAGHAGVRISQFSGAEPGTLYPGVHFTLPFIEHVELFNTRDRVYSTILSDDPKKSGETLRVQTKEGLSVGLAVTVRFKLDPSKLPYIYSNLPQPVEQEIVPPVVATAFRQTSPNYEVREMFASPRDEIVRAVSGEVVRRLTPDGVIVKEVMLRDIQLPAEYAKGMEGLLLKEQENERLSVELQVKLKMVREAELEALAQKAREVTEAEAKAEVTVLEAKAQADAMQHTLPLKQKQIEQSRLEAEARKESTVKNAEAMAQAKVIDSKAELERRKLMTEGESDRIRRVAAADAERLKMEASVLKDSPLLIQKIIAEKLSDKVQIMMVPNDGKFFFANDVLKGNTAVTAAKDQQ